MAKASPIRGLDPQAPVTKNAQMIVKARLNDFYDWEKFVDLPYSIRELHNLRIAAKRLRYTFEVFEEVLPPACEAFVEQLTQLQDELGAVHDSDVLIALLRLCLANQDSEAISATERLDAHAGQQGQRGGQQGQRGGQQGQQGQQTGKTLVSPELLEHLVDASKAPTIEQRYGLEQLLQRKEHEREDQYAAFRQHWYQLKIDDFRRQILTSLGV